MATSTKPRPPSNTFLRTVDEIEKSVYDAQAMRNYYSQSSLRLKKIKDYIKLAFTKKNNLFIKQSLGHALYTAIEIESRKAGRQKRCSLWASALKKYMDTIVKEVGNATFDKMIAVNDQVTLMFAIDTTGGMQSMIGAAKAIAKYVINHPRQYPIVDYILSPFNDPSK